MEGLHETEIDGVRCFWADSHRPTLSATLLFRQGMADEPFVESGWLHLLEHLCLHGHGGGVLEVNGSVSILETSFDSHGPPELVRGELEKVCGWLATPHFTELEREKNVLRAEARLRTGPVLRALNWRYGAQGPGLADWREPGLSLATPESLRTRTARVFSTQNAVLCLNGPPPTNLRLPLREGPYLDAPTARPCETGPAMYVDESGLVLSGLVERSEAATWAPEVIQRSLVELFRQELGGSYAPYSQYTRVDARTAVIVAGCDVLPEVLPHLAERALDLVARMKSWPVPTTWLEEIRASRLQHLADPQAEGAQAWRAGGAAILGEEPDDLARVIELTRTVGNDAVWQEVSRFCDSLLLGLPGESAWANQLPRVEFPEGESTTEGTKHRSVNWPADQSELGVAADRVTISTRSSTIEVRIPEVVGMFAYQDGGRHLISSAGWTMPVEPTKWQRGAALVPRLDELVPAHLHLPQGERPAPEFAKWSFAARWWGYVKNKRILGSLVIGVPILAAAGLYYLWSGGSPDRVQQNDLQGLGGVVVLVVTAILIFSAKSGNKT